MSADTEAAALSIRGKNLRAMGILVGIVVAAFTTGMIYMRWDLRMEGAEKAIDKLTMVVEKLADRMGAVEKAIDRLVTVERK